MKILALSIFVLLICLSSSAKINKKVPTYTATSPVLSADILKNVVFTIDKTNISFRGCNVNFGKYTRKNNTFVTDVD